MFKDSYGRQITYMRISVTDRCNLRCIYCMPADGIRQTTHKEILTFDEIVRIARIGAGKGISRIKITGGEPLVRKNVAALIRMLKAVPGIEQVTLTTNGALLTEQIDSLVKSGLDAVNISLDTVDEVLYKKITRCGDLASVLQGIKKACSYPGLTVKLNCVPLGKMEDTQILQLVRFASETGVCVRFIEMMPVGLGKYCGGRSQEELRKLLEREYGKAKREEGSFGNGPAVYYRFEKLKEKVGFISAVSHQFCDSCNRVRVTAQGYLKTCLQYSTGVDLKSLLRSGAPDSEVEKAFFRAIAEKPLCHHFTEKENVEEHIQEQELIEQKGMSEIGG